MPTPSNLTAVDSLLSPRPDLSEEMRSALISAIRTLGPTADPDHPTAHLRASEARKYNRAATEFRTAAAAHHNRTDILTVGQAAMRLARKAITHA